MALSTHDQVPDSPTNVFATLNPLSSSEVTLSDGNIESVISITDPRTAVSNFSVSKGKWYVEIYYKTTSSNDLMLGVVTDDYSPLSGATRGHTVTSSGGSVGYYASTGNKRIDHSDSAYSTTYTATNIIGIFLNLDDSEITYYKDNSSRGTITTKSFSGGYTFYASNGGGGSSQTVIFNFGQDHTFGGYPNSLASSSGYSDANGIGSFYYSPPTGALALCTANLPDPDIDPAVDDLPEDYMKAVKYTGNGGTQSIGVGFQPDLVWIKARNTDQMGHILTDSVRTAGNALVSNAMNQQDTNSSRGYLNEFLSNGFKVTSGTTDAARVNDAAYNYVAWCFRAGGAPTADNTATSGAMTANSVSVDGTLQSSYTPAGSPTIYPKRMSVNTKAGVSIVKYVGNDTVGATVPHGLSSAPEFFVIKNLDSATNWPVYHIGTSTSPENYRLKLNATDGIGTAVNYWNNTKPNSSVVTLYSGSVINISNNYVMYCWHSVAGYSAFGSYIGNGSTDGTFVYTGFKPAWVMVKRTDVANSWVIIDNARNTTNVVDKGLYADLNNAEQSSDRSDFLSNGFKLRTTFNELNASSGTYIYAAFAEQPFKYATAR